MSDSSAWLSLREAADMLGVHPATVRNWADDGKLPARRTPGGHRRFRRADLLQYAETHVHGQSDIQPTEVQVILQNALGKTRMEIGTSDLVDAPWYTAMSETGRMELRERGRSVLEALRQYIATDAPDEGLSIAITLGKEYATILSNDGLTLPQAVRGLFYFSDFVINSVLTWSELTPRSTSEWGTMLRQVNTFINTMLLSIIEFYEEE